MEHKSEPPVERQPEFRDKVKPVMQGARTAAVSAAKMAQQGARRAWPVIEPQLRRAWLNLRVWIPQLSNPAFRARQVAYDRDEYLHDSLWSITLPQQCWLTGRTDSLTTRGVELPLRSSENPLQIVIGTVGGAALFFLIWLLTDYGALWLVLVSLLVGYGVLYLKSWAETVQIKYWAAADVTEEMPAPEVVGFDGKLYVIWSDARLADLARKEVAAHRQARAQGRAHPTTGSSVPPHRAAPGSLSAPAHDPTIGAPAAPSGIPYKREELPPLKLDE